MSPWGWPSGGVVFLEAKGLQAITQGRGLPSAHHGSGCGLPSTSKKKKLIRSTVRSSPLVQLLIFFRDSMGINFPLQAVSESLAGLFCLCRKCARDPAGLSRPPLKENGLGCRYCFNRCLTVFKLDGFSFVGELKHGIETTFDHLPMEGPGRIARALADERSLILQVIGAYFEKLGSKSFAFYSIAVTDANSSTLFMKMRY
ncbi:phox domain-containing protein, partial [Perilla frutescens var. frutescens]